MPRKRINVDYIRNALRFDAHTLDLQASIDAISALPSDTLQELNRYATGNSDDSYSIRAFARGVAVGWLARDLQP